MLPTPPDYPYIAQHVLWISVFLVLCGLTYTVMAVRKSIATRSTVPLAIAVTGAMFTFPESVNCLLNCIYWTVSPGGEFTLTTLLGHKMDLHVLIVWWSYVAVIGYMIYDALEKGWSAKKLWNLYAFSVLCDVVVEILFLGVGGLYVYYGNQPLVIIGGDVNLPLWWMFMNNAGLFLGISIVYTYRQWFNGWRSLLVLILLPLVYVAVDAATAMPTAFAINSPDMAWLPTQLIGIATCLLCLAVVRSTMKLILKK